MPRVVIAARGPARRAAWLAAVATLAVAVPARAGTPWSVEPFVSGLAGVIHRHEAYGFDAGLAVRVSSFRSTLVAPMRFDRDGLRRRDWDERTDFGRIVAELAWGDDGDPFQVRVAAIPSLTLGVGNLVCRFASVVDVDHWRTGLVASLDFRPAGGVVFVDSVPDPAVAGGRVHVRPFFWADDRGTFGRLEIGLTLAGDARVPSGPFPGPPDRHGVPVSRTGAMLAGGIDLRWPVHRGDVAEVTPYGAWSRLGTSDGAVAGLALDFAPSKDVRFAVQGEWRWLGPGYVAGWFDGLYMAERHEFGGVPKAVARLAADASRMGGMAGVSLGWEPYVTIGSVIEWDGRPEFRKVRGDLVVTVPDRARATATIGARGFATAADLGRPDRLVGAASLDVSLYRSIAIFAAYAHDLEVVPNGRGSSRTAGTDTVLAGIRLGLVFHGDDGATGGGRSRSRQ